MSPSAPLTLSSVEEKTATTIEEDKAPAPVEEEKAPAPV